ncbi:type II CAAX prenyl endopeptidase Rce1 family protein [Pedobacter sp. SL55]|uniref:type II CAAX prenyl endopeptidase Rce1 family protein n=1 Tax=Pedobacter sp. SL55 TaxID=2995161 RepID=UPI00227197A8|nr:CPBP family glutamic-type intramembrane protease [Pedobacter sp. SL55]WAC42184.1 hypothetical protein OVA16_07470 [Pedobacter sp. SL55]
MNTIKNFIFFYLNPGKEVVREYTFYDKLKGTGSLLVFNFLFLIFSGVLINTLLIEFGLLIDPTVTKKSFTLIEQALVFGVLIAPLVEEIISRVWLVYSDFNISIAVSTLVVVLIFKILMSADYHRLIDAPLNAFVLLSVGIVIFYSTQFLVKKSLEVSSFISANIRILATMSGVAFGYLHLYNYKITLNLLLLSPIVLINYIVGGLLIGYIRIRFSFFYAVLLHIAFNAVLLLIKYR